MSIRRGLATITSIIDAPTTTRVVKITGALTVVAFAFGFGGYTLRDHELVVNSHTLADILVLQRHDDKSFTLQTANGQAFNAEICTPVDWKPREKLKVINYEQREGCKSIIGKNLGFLAYTDDHGNRILFQEIAHE